MRSSKMMVSALYGFSGEVAKAVRGSATFDLEIGTS
jgi:hypothetical protein